MPLLLPQVGKDQGAQRFLATLDKDPQVGKMIDATCARSLFKQRLLGAVILSSYLCTQLVSVCTFLQCAAAIEWLPVCSAGAIT